MSIPKTNQPYLDLIDGINIALDNNLFNDVANLKPIDKMFIKKLILFHNNVILHILNIKTEFNPFIHAVIPFAVHR